METKVLVTYASKYGATKEIAEKIGEVFHQAGLQADVIPVDGVRDLNTYGAIVLGSALYIGKWQKEAVAFLNSNEKTLAERPVWLFSIGPTGVGDPITLVEGVLIPPALQPVTDRIHPRDIVVFHGHINPEKMNFIEKWAIKSVVKKPFGDYRDWKAIASWSSRVADSIKASQPS